MYKVKFGFLFQSYQPNYLCNSYDRLQFYMLHLNSGSSNNPMKGTCAHCMQSNFLKLLLRSYLLRIPKLFFGVYCFQKQKHVKEFSKSKSNFKYQGDQIHELFPALRKNEVKMFLYMQWLKAQINS